MSDNRGFQVQSVVPLTPVVKWLIILNVGIWLVLEMLVGKLILGWDFSRIFGMVPGRVIEDFFVWQVGTYMFLHSTLSPMHLVLNMLMLWWLGSELEQRWGSRFFLSYYIVTGIGAALIYLIAHTGLFLLGKDIGAWGTPVVGASGAIFGLLLAYGILFGERIVYFFLVFPMKAKYFVMILAAMELATMIGGGGQGEAILCHLGGLVAGFLFLTLYTRFQQRRWRKQGTKRGRGLRLVVNNDKKDDEKGPRYWN